MKELKCVVFLGVVTFLWPLSRGDTEVSCVFNEICILPCTFQALNEPVVHWSYLTVKDESVVHSYYESKEQLEIQNKNFTGRTSMFLDQLSSRNASLQLKGSKVQDQGRYRCKVSTTGGTEQSLINVTVDALVKTVVLNQAENGITCSSDGIYPEPDVTWFTNPPSKVFLISSTIVQLTEQKLYNISSFLMVPNDTNVTYSCTISTRRNSMTKSDRLVMEHPERNRVKSQGMGIVAGVIMVTILMSFLPCCAEQIKKHWKYKHSSQQCISMTEEHQECKSIIIDEGLTNFSINSITEHEEI